MVKLSNIPLVLLICLTIHLSAKKVYVNDNSITGDIYTSAVGSATNTGLTSGSPKLTLAQGLSISVNGDTILVDKGNYISTTNAINVQVTIIGAGSGNTIFTGNATVNRFGTISVNNVKIMNMNFINYYLNQEGQVLLINSNLTGIVFENIVIRKNPGTNTAGANVLVSSGSNVIFNNCAFSCSGWNADYGGAIYVDNSTIAVNNCLFIDNKNFIRYGGAIYMYGANPNVTIQNTTFSKCSARRGGAIYQNSGILKVDGCCFLNNFSAGDASDPNNGGGAFCQFAGTSKFTNCQFNNNYNSQGADPNNASVDGGAILFRGAIGTFSFNTCSFANNIPYDTGADFYLDKGASLTGIITNCTFTTAPLGEVNIRNFDMATTDVVIANSGTPSFAGTAFAALGSNTLLPTSTPTAQCKNTTIAGCGTAINCATETLPPLIISCVPNKTLTGCSGILGNYIPEVVAFDDCAFTISQNPSAGTVITAITQVTMTVTDLAGNNSTCTFYVTPGSGGVTLTASATTSITCFGAATGSATVTPSGGAGTYTVTWMPGSLLGPSQTGLIANNYTVTTNDGVCNTTIIVPINQPLSPITISLTATSYSICPNNTITLSPTGANSYTLNPGNLSNTNFSLSPTSTTTYTITGSNTNGCLSANTITTTITVNASPTVALASVSSPTICSGNSTTITASGANSYTLSSATQTLTTNPFVVNPTATTIYTLKGISNLGCLSANTITTTITVNTTPTVAIASVSSPTICSGNSTTITASGANSYTLSSATQTLTTNPFVVNPTTTTTYTLKGISNLGCLSANTITTTINVNATPTVALASVSSPTICSENSATITAIGANSYTLSSATQTLTINPFVVNQTTTTTYSLIGINTAECLSANTITTTITVNTTPTVAIASISSPTICSGNSTTITASGANSYTLSSTTQTLTTNPFVVNPTTTTTFTLKGISNLGCLSANTITTTITVNTTPTLALPSSGTTLCSGNPLILNATASGSILWIGPNSYTSAATNPTVTNTSTILQAGTYSVTSSTIYGSQVCTSSVEHYSVSIVTSVNMSVASSNLCAGSTTTISPTGASTYTLISNLSSSTGISFTVSPTVNTTYTVLGSAGTGCNGTSIFTVNINALPILEISATNTVLCSNQSATLTVSGADSYTWSSTGLAVNDATLTISPLTNTTYSVTGTNTLTGCQNTSIIPIMVNTTPTVNITSSATNICKGDSITINLYGAASYTISSPTIITSSIAVISPNTTNTYTIIGTSSESCNSLPQTLSINVNDLPIISASNQTNCAGNTVTLSVSGANSYTWNPMGTTGNSLVVSPLITTTYSVIGTNTVTGCLSLETNVTVFTLTLPTATINANPTTICTTDNVNLVGTSTSTNVIYNWSLGNGITPSNQNLSTINFPANSLITGNYIYSLTVTSIEGCVSVPITRSISIVSAPNSEFNLSDLQICKNETGIISINNSQAGVIYNWNIAGIEIFNSNPIVIPSAIINNTGTYTVSVMASIGTCSNSAINTLTVSQLPDINLINPIISVCENSSLKLEVFNPINTYTYTWIINNVIDSFGSTVNLDPITLLNSGTYSVNVIDENGCRNSAIGNITIKTCILFVPEMFTPNFDGKNDAFVISGLENYPNNNLSIYNRWGNKVYYKEKYDNEFKGFPNVGNTLSKDKLPVGTYYVIIDFGDKKMKNYSGILQLQY